MYACIADRALSPKNVPRSFGSLRPHSFIKQNAANAAHKALRLEQVKIRALRAPNHQEFWRKLSS